MNFRSEKAFTLIEIVVVVLILGLLTAMLFRVMEPLMINFHIEKTRNNMATVIESLENYVMANDALPCPARIDAIPTDPDYGTETDCTAAAGAGIIETAGRGGSMVRIGAIPVRTIDLPYRYIADGWNSKFLYAVTVSLTDDATYDNNAGAIYIQDAAGNDVTSIAGNVLYTILSHGSNGAGSRTTEGTPDNNACYFTELEGENCDGDATFISTTRREGTQLYDDEIFYQSFIGYLNQPRCGNRGMLYAPSHPEADVESCLDPGYKREETLDINDTLSVTCTSAMSTCSSSWITIKGAGDEVRAGDYLVHWDAFLRFNYPQQSQYGMVQFEVDGDVYDSPKITFASNLCDDDSASPIQGESGLIDFSIDTDSIMRVRISLYGGEYQASNCSGNDPELELLERGLGTGSTKSMTFDFYRKPQTF